jgi:hypothetical protein
MFRRITMLIFVGSLITLYLLPLTLSAQRRGGRGGNREIGRSRIDAGRARRNLDYRRDWRGYGGYRYPYARRYYANRYGAYPTYYGAYPYYGGYPYYGYNWGPGFSGYTNYYYDYYYPEGYDNVAYPSPTGYDETNINDSANYSYPANFQYSSDSIY